MMMVGAVLIAVIMSLFVFIVFQLQAPEVFNLSKHSLANTLETRAAQLVDLLVDIDEEGESSEAELQAQLDDTIALISEFNTSTGSSEKATAGIADSLSTIAFSFGAVGFVILLIQISVQFMRYYARLAKLYLAQADALRASNGDPAVAFEFIQHFSPASVELGKAPASVYEKALETISSVYKR